MTAAPNNAASTRPFNHATQGGFTLLEMMFALVLFSISAASIASVYSSAGAQTTDRNKKLIATQLVRGVILDVEEKHQLEYLKDGSFPDELEGQDCDVPEPWDDVFTCRYDLVGLDADIEVMSKLAQGGIAGLMGGQDPKELGKNGVPNLEALGNLGGNTDLTKMMALTPLMGPDGPLVMQTCGINISAVLQSLVAMDQTYPMIVQKAAEQTRKLTVRLSYRERAGTERTLTVETFIIGIPREALKQMEKLDQIESELGLEEGGQLPGMGIPATGGTKK